MEEMKILLLKCRDDIRFLELKKGYMLDHGFQEEARILQIQISERFKVYDIFRDYYEKETESHIEE